MNLFRFVTTNTINDVKSESRIANESPKTFFQKGPIDKKKRKSIIPLTAKKEMSLSGGLLYV